MKSIPGISAALLLLGLAILALAFFAPLPVPYYQDFSVMYFTGKALIHGIPVYDYPAQLTFVSALTPPGFSFFAYPYPPWYALSTLFLAWMPIQVAARVWFFLNIGMLSLSIWLLTTTSKIIPRVMLVLAALLFIPSLGLIVVGQYSAPVLLGAASFIHAVRQKNPLLLAVALLLMTFKPHIGGLLFVAGVTWLTQDRSAFARRALWLTSAGGAFLLLLGFLADPAWPVTYFQSLLRYSGLPGVQTCGLCASLSVSLIRIFSGQANTTLAAGLSLGLALLAGCLLFGRFRSSLREPFFLMAVFANLSLLIDPYLLNYDYILLLLPLLWLAGSAPWLSLLIYFVPWGELALGRGNNFLLAGAALVTFILILQYSLKISPAGIDSLSAQAYNQSNK